MSSDATSSSASLPTYKIAIAGASGRMGRMLIEAVQAADDAVDGLDLGDDLLQGLARAADRLARLAQAEARGLVHVVPQSVEARLAQERAHLRLGISSARDRIGVLRRQHDDHFRSRIYDVVGTGGRHGACQHHHDAFRAVAVRVVDVVRILDTQHRDGARFGWQAALDVQRLPRIFIFVLSDDMLEARDMPLRVDVDGARRAADVRQRELLLREGRRS